MTTEPARQEASGPAGGGHDPYTALRLPDFRRYLTGSVLANFGMQMQTVAVGWEIYERTGSAMALGWVGLVQFAPVLALALVAGQVADKFDRRRIVLTAQLFIAAASLGLTTISLLRGPVLAMYGCLLLSGMARAMNQPAKASLLPQIVPRERFSNAVTWSGGGFQLASVLGPGVGGLLIALFGRAFPVYILDASATLTFAFLLSRIRPPRFTPSSETPTVQTLLAGVAFVWQKKIILGTITLDLFAVLLGGAVTLLPVYAKDILQVGPTGLGWMRAAPSIGALLMSFTLAHRPPLERAGRAMLWSVAGFGVATIVFGLSRSFWLSLAMLFLTGALDMISVVVRHTLVQLLTPDAMRGRVSAINGLFIGASNELGGFESGLVAALFNPTLSVVSGGIGTIVAVMAVALLWPQVRRYGRLGGAPEPHDGLARRPDPSGFPVLEVPQPAPATEPVRNSR